MKAKIIISCLLFNSFIMSAQNGQESRNYALLSLLITLLFLLLFYLIPIIDILKSKFESGVDKLIWLAAVIFVPFLGLLLYLLIGRKQKANYKK